MPLLNAIGNTIPSLRGGCPPFPEVPGLAGWWEANDPATIGLNGPNVATLADKSPAGADFAQATAAFQPAWVGTGFPKHIDFSGPEPEFMELASAIDLGADALIVMALRPTSFSGNQLVERVLDNTNRATAVTTKEVTVRRSDLEFINWAYSDIGVAWHIFSITQTSDPGGDILELFINGISQGTRIAASTLGVGGISYKRLGTAPVDTPSNYDGQFGALTLADGLAAHAARQDLERYFACQFGFALP